MAALLSNLAMMSRVVDLKRLCSGSAEACEEFVGDTPVSGNYTPVSGNYTPVSGNHTLADRNYVPVFKNHKRRAITSRAGYRGKLLVITTNSNGLILPVTYVV